MLLHQVGSVAFVVLRRYTRRGRLRKALRVTFITMTIGLAALAGVPGFAGFFSKDAIIEAAWEHARDGSAVGWIVLVSVCLTVALTAFYCVRLWLWVFFRTPALAGALGAFEDDDATADLDEPDTSKLRDAPWVMLTPLVLLAIASIVLGYVDGRTAQLGGRVGVDRARGARRAAGVLVVVAGCGSAAGGAGA